MKESFCELLDSIKSQPLEYHRCVGVVCFLSFGGGVFIFINCIALRIQVTEAGEY